MAQEFSQKTKKILKKILSNILKSLFLIICNKVIMLTVVTARSERKGPVIKKIGNRTSSEVIIFFGKFEK